MVVVVTASNVLVQFQINDWLTWGAFTYPAAFLITDLINRRLGPKAARYVVCVGFAAAVLVSAVVLEGFFDGPRIALASGVAFLAGQMLDVSLFNRMRDASAWWQPPLVSSVFASALDTVLFFGLAFAGTDVPWMTLAAGDYGVKLLTAGVLLIPFRLLMNVGRPVPST
ncbi:MAG: VUT family protein [Gammaproteobacteria bacterium]